MNKAMKDSIITGLQVFMTLGLDGRPAEDTVVATAKVWCELISPLREWDDEDIANLQTAFKTTARQVNKWPQPFHVINNLQPKVRIGETLPMPALSPEQKQKIDKTIGELFEVLGVKPIATKTPTNVNIERTYDK